MPTVGTAPTGCVHAGVASRPMQDLPEPRTLAGLSTWLCPIPPTANPATCSRQSGTTHPRRATGPPSPKLDHRWDAGHDSDVLDVLRQLPPGFTYGEQIRHRAPRQHRHRADSRWYELLPGRSQHSSPSSTSSALLPASRKNGSHPQTTHKPSRPSPTRTTPRAGGLLGAEPRHLLLLVRLLINSEPSLWIGLGGPDSDGHWQATLHRNIRRFRNVTSLDEYWALRHKPWEPSSPDPDREGTREGRPPSGLQAREQISSQFAAPSHGWSGAKALGLPSGDWSDSNPARRQPSQSFADNRKAVMVIYGHDREANNALFDWLRAIGLQPREWSKLVQATGIASPYIGQVLHHAFQQAQAVVALFTPDERVLAAAASPDDPRAWRLQARPNVLIEAAWPSSRTQTGPFSLSWATRNYPATSPDVTTSASATLTPNRSTTSPNASTPPAATPTPPAPHGSTRPAFPIATSLGSGQSATSTQAATSKSANVLVAEQTGGRRHGHAPADHPGPPGPGPHRPRIRSEMCGIQPGWRTCSPPAAAISAPRPAATSSGDNTARLWKTATGNCLRHPCRSRARSTLWRSARTAACSQPAAAITRHCYGTRSPARAQALSPAMSRL